MIYVFDLDGTLCSGGCAYEDATQFPARIDKVNQLFADGHTIVIETARGSVTGQDWHRVTADQLRRWGVKYHELRTGKKVYGDVYVDDKGINAAEFFA